MKKVAEKLIDLRDGKINTISFGKGKPLFLIPGWTYSSKVYALLMPYLSEEYQVTGIDLPGWAGKSTLKLNNYGVASYVKMIVDSFKIIYQEQKNLVNIGGVSCGGTLALLAANNLNGKIDKIIVQSAPSNGSCISKNKKIQTKLLGVSKFIPFYNSVWNICHHLHALGLYFRCRPNIDNQIKGQLLNEYLMEYSNLNPKAILDFTADFLASDFTRLFRNTKNKTIVIGCEKDSLVPISEMRNISQNILPNPVYYELQKAHHYFLGENPKKFAEIIKENI